MIFPQAIGNAGKASAYYANTARAAEYYSGESVPSQWTGKGAAELSLQGTVQKEDLRQTLEGKVTDRTGERLLGRSDGKGNVEHRAGWDFTISAPKGVSIAGLVHGRDDVLEAHREATKAAMRYMEQHAQARVNGQTVPTGNLAIATFEHVASRAGDPQIHTHALVANATMYEGKAYSLESKGLFRVYRTADSIYHNELSNRLQKCGLEVTHDAHGRVDLADYDKAARDVFSKRGKQIEDELSERDKTRDQASRSERNTIALATRADKNTIESREANQERWQTEARYHGIAAPSQSSENSHVANNRDEQAQAKHAVSSAVSHLSERDFVFTQDRLHREAARFAQGKAGLWQIQTSIAQAERNGDLIRRGDKYTTKAAVEAEKALNARLTAGRGRHDSVCTEREFTTALKAFEKRKGFELGEEQRGAARMILTGDDRFQGVQGLAGTGKTTMLEFVREAAESKGWEVVGHSNGAAQASVMERESGIKSTTTAGHLRAEERSAGRDDGSKTLAQQALETYRQRPDLSAKLVEGRMKSFTGRPVSWNDMAHKYGIQRDAHGGRYFRDGDGWVHSEAMGSRKRYLWETESYRRDAGGRVERSGDGGKTWTQLGRIASFRASQRINERIKTLQKEHGKDPDYSKSLANGTFKMRAKEGYAETKNGHMLRTKDYGKTWERLGAVKTALAHREINARIRRGQAREIDRLELTSGQAPKRELRIMDEAGMAGHKEFARVVSTTEASGSRTVFLGDKKQHQAVEAGKAFARAQASMPTAELGRASVRRQKTEGAVEIREAVLDRRYGDAMKHAETVQVRATQDALPDNAGREDKRDAAGEDNHKVIDRMASDYAKLPKEQRASTLIVTGTNDDRQELNEKIRNELRDRGQLGEDRDVTALRKVDMTGEEQRRASSYAPGQVIEAAQTSKSQRMSAGERFKVIDTHSRSNTLRVRDSQGNERLIEPGRAKLKTYTPTPLELASGDQVKFTENHKLRTMEGREQRVLNGQSATVDSTAGDTIRLRTSNGDRIELDSAAAVKMDHDYSSTSHAAQGKTVQDVWAHHNTERGAHGDREAYVNLTRETHMARIYTQDSAKAERQMGTTLDKSSAVEFSGSPPDRLKAAVPQPEKTPEPAATTSAPTKSPAPAHELTW